MIKKYLVEIFLVFILILNLMDFLKILPHDLDVLKKFISMITIGYIFYKVNTGEILFGKEASNLTPPILMGYFLLIFKDITYFAVEMAQISKGFFFKPAIQFLAQNSSSLDSMTFVSGVIVLGLVSVYTRYAQIKGPCIMHAFNSRYRLFPAFIILVAFFLLLFNIVVEWVGLVIDSSIFIVGIIFYLFLVFRYHRHFDPQSMLFRVGHFQEKFYENFLKLFHTRKGILLGISGILVLHLLTDAIRVIIQFVFGINQDFYGTELPFFLDLIATQTASGADMITLVLTYILSLTGFVFLMVLPSYIWFLVYRKKNLKVKPAWLGLFFSTLIIFLSSKIFQLAVHGKEASAGANINIATARISYEFLLISAVAFIVVFAAAHYRNARRFLSWLATGIIITFVGLYLSYFAFDLIRSYLYDVLYSFLDYRPIHAIMMSVFLLIASSFYALGYYIFVKEALGNVKKT